MSTPTPTPTPTPRTYAAKIKSGFAAVPDQFYEFARTLETELSALRAEVERLRSDRDCEKRLRKDADEFRENAITRATKAEADLVALEQSFDDNCRGVVKIADDLATERARLDAVISNSWLVYHCSDSSFAVFSNICADYVSPWLATKRSAIDAAMKEGAK